MFDKYKYIWALSCSSYSPLHETLESLEKDRCSGDCWGPLAYWSLFSFINILYDVPGILHGNQTTPHFMPPFVYCMLSSWTIFMSDITWNHILKKTTQILQSGECCFVHETLIQSTCIVYWMEIKMPHVSMERVVFLHLNKHLMWLKYMYVTRKSKCLYLANKNVWFFTDERVLVSSCNT